MKVAAGASYIPATAIFKLKFDLLENFENLAAESDKPKFLSMLSMHCLM